MDEVHQNFANRRQGLVRALTDGASASPHARSDDNSRRLAIRRSRRSRGLCARGLALATPNGVRLTIAILFHSSRADVEEFYAQCDPDKENLCLYGNPDGTWEVQLPAEEVPPELPEPALGINFARDGMQVRDISLRRVRASSASSATFDRDARTRRSNARARNGRAVALTDGSRARGDDAAQGLARARRGAQRCVAHGGGVLLRRQVRREEEVRRNARRGKRWIAAARATPRATRASDASD